MYKNQSKKQKKIYEIVKNSTKSKDLCEKQHKNAQNEHDDVILTLKFLF